MRAGTAQKIVLNAISTGAMIRLGKTYGNRMVDVVATNAKLRARSERLVRELGGDVDARVAARRGGRVGEDRDRHGAARRRARRGGAAACAQAHGRLARVIDVERWRALPSPIRVAARGEEGAQRCVGRDRCFDCAHVELVEPGVQRREQARSRCRGGGGLRATHRSRSSATRPPASVEIAEGGGDARGGYTVVVRQPDEPVVGAVDEQRQRVAERRLVARKCFISANASRRSAPAIVRHSITEGISHHALRPAPSFASRARPRSHSSLRRPSPRPPP